jgi:hypothetical protein
MTAPQQYIDINAILETTQGAPRDKVLRFREELRHLLRSFEDMHTLPYSFQTKVERGEALPKTEHHNR